MIKEISYRSNSIAWASLLTVLLRSSSLIFSILPFLVTSLDPEQVRLAYWKTPDVMVVQWATPDRFCEYATVVEYGDDPLNLQQRVGGACFKFDLGEGRYQQSNHVAYMTNLKASTRYYYRVGDGVHDDSWSKLFNFQTAPAADTIDEDLPQRFLVFGDIGSGSWMPEPSDTIISFAATDIQKNGFDMMLHVGTFAYDFETEQGDFGRRFLNEVSNMSAYVPYMVDRGKPDRTGFSMAHYTTFFKNKPRNALVSNLDKTSIKFSERYYSWNVGLVHFIALSSELYFERNAEKLIEEQWNWFKADLELASSNRTAAPWIIVHAHHSLYCSFDDNCDGFATRLRAGIPREWRKGYGIEYRFGLEQLLYSYGVDLWINGYGSYERMHAIAPKETYSIGAGIPHKNTIGPQGTVYIVAGAADSHQKEENGEFLFPESQHAAFRSTSFGYSRMTIYNSTHLQWEQLNCDVDSSSIGRNLRRRPKTEGDVLDTFWLVQHQHGPFANH